MKQYDPTDPDQFTERQEVEELARQQVQADWRFLLASPQGRRVLAAILNSAGLFRTSFVPGDALAIAFQEGRRDIAIQIYSAVTTLGQASDLTALLAEVTSPPNVSRASQSSPDRSELKRTRAH